MITLTGQGLDLSALSQIADGAEVALDPRGLSAMAAARDRLAAARASEQPIYGVTTGLGPRVIERLSPEEQVRMSVSTIRGRAHAVGQPLPVRVVRAMMAVRANTLLQGASGASPAVAEALCACLNAALTPVVRETGTIGAGDLMWGAQIGLGLIGEGQILGRDGLVAATEALSRAGVPALHPGPRDGLALVASSAPVAGLAGLVVHRMQKLYSLAQAAAALSYEAFRANVTPLLPEVIAARPQPGQAEAAAGVMTHLQDSPLLQAGAARRVQDPLSFRNVAQIHGAWHAALAWASEAVETEVNGASDNPVVLEDGRVLSSGGYLTPHLGVALNALALSCTHVAAAQTARMAKIIMPRFSDLPVGLVAGQTDGAGLAPAMKSAEALHAEIGHLAQPAHPYPGGAADGVEDVVTHSAIPAKALGTIAERMDRLISLELIVAAQAVDVRPVTTMAPAMHRLHRRIRALVPQVSEDQPMGDFIETLAQSFATWPQHD